MEYKTIQLAFDSGVATITLNRPEKRNAISRALVDELLAALDEIDRSSAQVVILTGAGKAFCAGMDLDELKALLGKTHDENVQDSSHMAGMFRRIYDFPLPTIAAVNGAAIAGGTGFATMCDFTLAVPEAKFGYTEVRIGFVPAIVSSMLVWQVGHKVARDLLLTGRLIDAAEAHRFRIWSTKWSSRRDLMTRARELAAQIMENSPSSVRATKKLINGFISGQLDGKSPKRSKTMRASARLRTFAKASRRFWKSESRTGAPSERPARGQSELCSLARAGCGCATLKPIRWEWSIMPTTSSGSKSDESN